MFSPNHATRNLPLTNKCSHRYLLLTLLLKSTLHSQQVQWPRWLFVGLALLLMSAPSPVKSAETGELPFETGKSGMGYPVRVQELIQWVVARNDTLLSKHTAVIVKKDQARAEASLYEPVWFAKGDFSNTDELRTESERTVNYTYFTADGPASEQEQLSNIATGVRSLLPSGGQATATFSYSDLENSLSAENDHEYQGALSLKVQQPLLRGFGREITETAKTVAAIEAQIQDLKYQAEVLSTVSNAAQMYWQLYRAVAVWDIRKSAADNARRLHDDLKRRVAHGQAARAGLIEANAAISERDAEVARARQLLIQVCTEITTLLGLNDQVIGEFDLSPQQQPDFNKVEEYLPTLAIQLALDRLPEYRIVREKMSQEASRLNYIRNRAKPKLDAYLEYRQNSLGYNSTDTFEKSFSDEHSDWFMGLELEMPLNGNRRADAEISAQKNRVRQLTQEKKALEQRLSSDIRGRWEQLQRAYDEVAQVQRTVELKEELLEIERNLFERGKTRLRDVLEREIELYDSRQRFVETAARVEIARIALKTADASLLEDYGVGLERTDNDADLPVSDQ